MDYDRLLEIGGWLNKRGYGLNLLDDLWMEEPFTEHSFRDVCKMINDFTKPKTCEWVWSANEEYYETQCGDAIVFGGGSDIEENNYKFCPYCSGKIIEKE